MIFGGDIKRVESYIRRLADLMGLRDWILEVSDDPPTDSCAAGSCELTYGRQRATVRLDTGWATWAPEDFRVVCVHELLHCHINAISETFKTIKPQLSESTYQVAYQSYHDRMEYCVDGVAVAWAKSLPLPEKKKGKP